MKLLILTLEFFSFSRFTTIVVFLLCMAAGQTVAQSNEMPGSEDLPEEITVTVPESMSRLRRALSRAENNLFDIYNQWNDDDQYDVKCKSENYRAATSFTATRLKVRVCRPNYYRSVQQEEAQNLYRQMGSWFETSGIGTNPNAWQPFHSVTPMGDRPRGAGTAALSLKNKALMEKFRAVIAESPEFVNAVYEFSVLNQAYQERQQE